MTVEIRPYCEMTNGQLFEELRQTLESTKAHFYKSDPVYNKLQAASDAVETLERRMIPVKDRREIV